MKLLVHLGLHRAASTSIQDWLRQAAAGLERQGCFTVAGPGTVFNLLAGNLSDEVGAEAMSNAMDAELEERAARFQSGIVSDENLLGPLPSRTTPALSAIGRIATVLSHLDRSHDVTPLLVLRGHLPWLTSLYRVAQFRCDTGGFPDFVKAAVTTDTPFKDLVSRIGQGITRQHPIVTSLEATTLDGGQRLLASIIEAAGVPQRPAVPFSKSNASPVPLICELRQKVARRGGLLILEGQPELVKKIGFLWHRRDQRTPAAIETLAEMVRDSTVKVPERYRFSERIAMGQDILRESGGDHHWLTFEQAREAVNVALRATAKPIAPPSDMERIWNRFEADRHWVSEHCRDAPLD